MARGLLTPLLLLVLPSVLAAYEPWDKSSTNARVLKERAKMLFGRPDYARIDTLPTFEELADLERDQALLEFQYQVHAALDSGESLDIDEVGLTPVENNKVGNKHRWKWKENPSALGIREYLGLVPEFLSSQSLVDGLLARGFPPQDLDKLGTNCKPDDVTKLLAERGLRVIQESSPVIRANHDQGLNNEEALRKLSFQLFESGAIAKREVILKCLDDVSYQGKKVMISWGADYLIQSGLILLSTRQGENFEWLESEILSGHLEEIYESGTFMVWEPQNSEVLVN